MKLLVVGNPGREHVGSHLIDAAQELGLDAELADTRRAAGRFAWQRRLCWHLLGRRPAALGAFNRELIETWRRFRPDVILATGIAPLQAATLRGLKKAGVTLVNYLTDDPWNRANSARHFWAALPLFDAVFSPRRAATPDLERLGCPRVEYLPFAYNPCAHFVERPPSPELAERYRCDLLIIGGADRDRIPLAEGAVAAGLDVHLYGGYWDRVPALRSSWKGFIYGQEMRWAVSAATANLVMGRKANRDGHAMRSYEVPAMGGAMVVEDTEDHRALFGRSGDAVLYYRTTEEMVDAVDRLRSDPGQADAMAGAAKDCVTRRPNAYAHRLGAMLESAIP